MPLKEHLIKKADRVPRVPDHRRRFDKWFMREVDLSALSSDVGKLDDKIRGSI